MKLSFLLLLFLVGCQDYNSNSADRDQYGPITLDPGDVNFQKAFPVLQTKCVSCHFHKDWAAYKTTEDWVTKSGRIVPGFPGSSILITKIINFDGSGNMPQGLGPLPQEEYDALVKWVTEIP